LINYWEIEMTQTYLTTEGLAERIHYDKRTIRERLNVDARLKIPSPAR
jgi:hypothetical protein